MTSIEDIVLNQPTPMNVVDGIFIIISTSSILQI